MKHLTRTEAQALFATPPKKHKYGARKVVVDGRGELEGDWKDLPVASFAEAGTNVPTVLLRIRKASA